MPPSHFAKRGQPTCSLWGKSEIEWLALAYVQALAADGDVWKRLPRERVLELLTEEHQRFVYPLLKFDHYDHWFQMVADRLKNSEGASEVWRVSFATISRLAGLR